MQDTCPGNNASVLAATLDNDRQATKVFQSDHLLERVQFQISMGMIFDCTLFGALSEHPRFVNAKKNTHVIRCPENSTKVYF